MWKTNENVRGHTSLDHFPCQDWSFQLSLCNLSSHCSLYRFLAEHISAKCARCISRTILPFHLLFCPAYMLYTRQNQLNDINDKGNEKNTKLHEALQTYVILTFWFGFTNSSHSPASCARFQMFLLLPWWSWSLRHSVDSEISQWPFTWMVF